MNGRSFGFHMLASLSGITTVGLTSAALAKDFDTIFDSAIELDLEQNTITLPLFRGTHEGEDVWYIVLDASDRDVAEDEFQVNWAPKLANALGTVAVQEVQDADGVVQFQGTVDFTPERILVANPETGFPPDRAEPGSIGDADYSPLVTRDGRVVLNAPQVANSTGVHDSVVSIDFAGGAVQMRLVDSRYDGNRTLYISTEASDPVTATLEEATFAPNLNAAPGLASGDRETSARSALLVVVNGETGIGNPDRQGLESAVMGEGDPVNTSESFPNNRRGSGRGYSPMWDVHPLVWTDDAIAGGLRVLLDDKDDIVDLIEDEVLVSGGFGPRNPDLAGLRAAGIIVNCPMVAIE